jgi:hypothetical protein
MPMNDFENHPSNDDQIVEITDLEPNEAVSSFSSMFKALEKRPSLRKRFWGIATAICTVLFILPVLFSTFSSVRGLAFRFFRDWNPLTPLHWSQQPPLLMIPMDIPRKNRSYGLSINLYQ